MSIVIDPKCPPKKRKYVYCKLWWPWNYIKTVPYLIWFFICVLKQIIYLITLNKVHDSDDDDKGKEIETDLSFESNVKSSKETKGLKQITDVLINDSNPFISVFFAKVINAIWRKYREKTMQK